MAIKGLTLDTTRDFVSDYDDAKGTPDETVFVIGALDSRIFGILRDRATSISVDPSRPDDTIETNINANEVAFQTVQYGLKGWRNFKDEKGSDIVYKSTKKHHGSGRAYDVVDPDLVSQLPAEVISELAEAIRDFNEVTEEEAKN